MLWRKRSKYIASDYVKTLEVTTPSFGAGLHSTNRTEQTGSRNALSSDVSLISEAAEGRTKRLIRAMQLGADMREDPRLRADVFVQHWQMLIRQRRALVNGYDAGHANKVADRMIGMARSLECGPQLESIGRARIRCIEIGL